jgi:hypothetical protein
VTARPQAVRLFLTVALVYAIHFAPNVVRETYLAVSIAERLSIRVDPYIGLHPDLFEIPGRGAFINSNPGASMLGAVPYAVARPGFEILYRLRPSLVAPKPEASYDDPRPNRTRFMNRMRARGLDVRLALAAASMQIGLNVPLGGIACVAVFAFLRARLRNEHTALWLALLFAFGTPMFFRSAFLNQNLLLAYCVLFAFLALTWRAEGATRLPRQESLRLIAAGALLGLAILCDYSAVPLLLAFGVWVTVLATRDEGLPGGLRAGAVIGVGAAPLIAGLLAYQRAAFGNPFLPAQAYMARTALSTSGWHGLNLPSADLLWRNLIDPGYGLFAFCPMLVAAFFAFKYRRRTGSPSGEELTLIYGASAALYLFSSSVAFASLQWNTGVRYLVPAVPLLFFAAVPVLLHAPRWIAWTLIAPTVLISWCVSMARENVPLSIGQIVTSGLALPWHTVLIKTSAAYAPGVPIGWLPIAIFLLTAVGLWLIWTANMGRPARDLRAEDATMGR